MNPRMMRRSWTAIEEMTAPGGHQPRRQRRDPGQGMTYRSNPRPPGGERSAGSREEIYRAPSDGAYKAAESYVEYVEEEFSNDPRQWVELVKKGNHLLKEAGGVEKAAESLWQVREHRDLMNLKGVECEGLRRGLLHPDLLDYLQSVRHYGMEARYVGPRHRVKAKLHPNARRSIQQVYTADLQGYQEAQSPGG